MKELAKLQAPLHRSHSQVTSYLECGEKYRLERIAHVPQNPAWYFVGGHVVHSVTEEYDRARFAGTTLSEIDIQELWHVMFRTEVMRVEQESGVELDQWRAGGRATKANPNKEDGAWWAKNGASQVLWYKRFVEQNDVDVWADGAGIPGIEYVFEHELEGVVIKGAVDRIVWHNGQLVVRDIKSGAKTPTNPLQLELYAHVLAEMFPTEPWGWADYYMTRKAATTPPHYVDPARKHRLVQLYKEADDGITRGFFPPNPSAWCGTCAVRDHCRLFGNDDSLSTVGFKDVPADKMEQG